MGSRAEASGVPQEQRDSRQLICLTKNPIRLVSLFYIGGFTHIYVYITYVPGLVVRRGSPLTVVASWE